MIGPKVHQEQRLPPMTRHTRRLRTSSGARVEGGARHYDLPTSALPKVFVGFQRALRSFAKLRRSPDQKPLMPVATSGARAAATCRRMPPAPRATSPAQPCRAYGGTALITFSPSRSGFKATRHQPHHLRRRHRNAVANEINSRIGNDQLPPECRTVADYLPSTDRSMSRPSDAHVVNVRRTERDRQHNQTNEAWNKRCAGHMSSASDSPTPARRCRPKS